MKNLSTRTYILLSALALIIIISPWLGGGLVEGFVFEFILILTSLSLFLFFMVFYIEKKDLILPKNKLILYFLIIFITGGIISSIFSIRSYNSWSEFIMWLVGIALFFILMQITDKNILQKFSWLFIIIGSLVSIVGFILFLLSASERDLRLDSVLYNPNLLSGYLIGIIPLAMILIFGKYKKLLYFINIILWTAYILTVSYTGWAAMMPVLLFYIIYFRKKIFNKKFILFSLLAILIIFINVFSLRYFHTSSVEEGLAVHKTISTSHTQNSFNQRWLFVKTGLKIFKNYPLTGIGLGNLKLAYQQIQETIRETPRSTHNNYIDIALEMGFLGIIGFAGFILVLLFKNITFLKTHNNLYFWGLFLGWLAMLIHGSVDFAWQIKIVVIQFFIFSGLMYGYYLKTSLKNKQTKISKFYLTIILILATLFLTRGIQIFLGNINNLDGEHLQNLKQYSQATDLFQKSYTYNPDPQTLAKIGILKYTQANYESSIEDAKLWTIKSYHDPAAYQLLGRNYKALNDLDNANKNFDKALELNPYGNAEIKADSLETKLALKQYELIISEAEDFINKYNGPRPGGTKENIEWMQINLAKILDYQGDAYLALGDKNKARASWKQALKERDTYYIAKQKLKKLEE